jgi:hypothetical protein
VPVDVDEFGPKLMVPRFDEISRLGENLHAVSQNAPIGSLPVIRKKMGDRVSFSLDRLNDRRLRVVPKADGRCKSESSIEDAFGKIPSDQETLSLRRMGLARIGSVDFAARQKVGVDPFLLHIEVIFIAAGEKEEREGSLD